MNYAKYLVNDLYHLLKYAHYVMNYRGYSANEPPHSINYIYHSAKERKHLSNDYNHPSNYCNHSLNDWQKTVWKEGFITGEEGFTGVALGRKTLISCMLFHDMPEIRPGRNN